MKLWERFKKSVIAGQHDQCPRCHVYLQLKGKLPQNHSERLVKKIMGERESVPLHWLEEQVSYTLYREELRLGAGTLDIGIWGPVLFTRDATRILAELRSEFASFMDDRY